MSMVGDDGYRPLAGKRAVVVGGAGGIGRATAFALARRGAAVTLTSRKGEADAAAVEMLTLLPGEGHSLHALDVGDSGTIRSFAEHLTAGCGHIDILVNAAGFTRPVPHADLDALDDELIDEMFRINWRGQFATVRALAPLLHASGDGLIIFISSIAGQTGIGSSIAYCAAKAGIDVLVKSLARVFAPEVRVLSIAPGVVNTQFVAGRTTEANAKLAASIPMRRIATPDDIAAAVAACATDFGYATGHVLAIDGGRSL